MDNGLTGAYFNYAGLAPASESVRQKQQEAEREFRTLLFSELGVRKYSILLNECRETISQLLNAPGSEGVVLLPNTSTGLNIALNALRLKPGGVVVTSDQEHPSVEIPLRLLNENGVKIERVTANKPKEMEEKIEALIKGGLVSLIVVSHVSYKDGRILPVENIGEIARKAQVPYVVDGAQAVGHVEVDVQRIKPWVYAFSGHKWLFGPMGTGGMWVTRKFLDEYAGVWSSWASKSAELNGSRLESGTLNYGLIVGLREAIHEILLYGEQKWNLLRNLRREVMDKLSSVISWTLSEWEGEHAPGIITYRLPKERLSWELAEEWFRDGGVVVKPFKPPEKPNAIRISFCPWTKDDEVSDLVRWAKLENYTYRGHKSPERESGL